MRRSVPVRGIANGVHQFLIRAARAQTVFRCAIQPEVDSVLPNQGEKAGLCMTHPLECNVLRSLTLL